MGIREIIMLYLTTYFVVFVLLTECVSSIASIRYQQITAKLPLTFKSMLVVLYLTSIVSASIRHEPQVYEELHEDQPEIVRRARHLDGTQNVYQPQAFDYRTATQQDPMKTRYHRQQQANFRHLKIRPNNPDEFFELHQYLSQNSGTPTNIQFEDTGNDWQPFQPNYVAPPVGKSRFEVAEKDKFAGAKMKVKDDIEDNTFENDLDIAGSENKEETVEDNVETDRGDGNSRYIYVQPNILRNNFGIDPKAAQEILKNTPPAASSANAEEFQISELKELLGKNPEYQLQGLQKLLEDAKPVMQNMQVQDEPAGVEIQPNSLSTLLSNPPPIEDLQKRLDAVNKAHEEAALAAAQQQAEAHVRAQHQAIELAQQRAEAETMAKIAAHNQGKSILNPNDHLQMLDGTESVTAAPLVAERPRHQLPLRDQMEQNSLDTIHEQAEESGAVENVEGRETSALNERPYEQVLLHPPHRDIEGYSRSNTDLRNSKPIISISPENIHQPAPFAKTYAGPPLLQPFAADPEVYAPSEVQNYSPVQSRTPNFEPQQEHEQPDLIPVRTRATFTPTLEEYGQGSHQQVDIDTSHSSGNQLYSEGKHDHEDLHQYAAKYAFGYRILDEKHGNDFGHEEEREGRRTKGHYFVLLPDGRKQKVDYFVDKSGYHAKVSYENVGRHPAYVPPHPQEYREHSDGGVHK